MIILSDEVCQVKMRDGSPCGRQIYAIDEMKCIFHISNESNIDEFETQFRRELDRMEKDEDIKDYDFTGFIFASKVDFNKKLFEKTVFFINAEFKEGADFSDAKFKNKAYFSGAQFHNRANFSNAKFNNEAYFQRVQFNNEVYFQRVQFTNKAYFSNAQFNNRARFSFTKFNYEGNFLEARFNNYADFVNAKFNEANFSGTQFIYKANFSDTQFNNRATFEDSEFHSVSSFTNAKFLSKSEDSISFSNIKFHKPKDVRFRNINLSNVSFLNTDITEVEFLDVKWKKVPLLKQFKFIGSRLAVVDEALIGKDDTTYDSVAQLYRRLRENYETNYRFAEAGEFFIGEMEMRRHKVSTRFKRFKIEEVIVLWFKRNFSLMGLYKYLSLYGESFKLPLIWASIVIVSYPILVHWLFNASLPQSDDFPYTYLRTSAASFFQLDNTYIGERLIGFLLLGLLFIALKRQFERKK